jgi:hypothetical protein
VSYLAHQLRRRDEHSHAQALSNHTIFHTSTCRTTLDTNLSHGFLHNRKSKIIITYHRMRVTTGTKHN